MDEKLSEFLRKNLQTTTTTKITVDMDDFLTPLSDCLCDNFSDWIPDRFADGQDQECDSRRLAESFSNSGASGVKSAGEQRDFAPPPRLEKCRSGENGAKTPPGGVQPSENDSRCQELTLSLLLRSCPELEQKIQKIRRSSAQSERSGAQVNSRPAAPSIEPSASSSPLSCHESTLEYNGFLDSTKFWLEGVGICVVGCFGIFGNVLTIVVLGRMQTNRQFNKLLMCLALVDSLLIVVSVIETAVIGTFMNTLPMWYKLAFPYFLNPFKGMVHTATIFMVVAVSAERYKAVCHPLR